MAQWQLGLWAEARTEQAASLCLDALHADRDGVVFDVGVAIEYRRAYARD